MTRPDGYHALPKRFKDYITALETHVQTLTAQVPAREKSDGRSVCLVDALHQGHDGYFPDQSQIEFTIRDTVYRVKRAELHHGIEGLEISTQFGGCVVYPRVSNVVVIGSDR